MLLEFSVKNFSSYKEKMTLSFEATIDKTLEEYFCYKINEKTICDVLIKHISWYILRFQILLLRKYKCQKS